MKSGRPASPSCSGRQVDVHRDRRRAGAHRVPAGGVGARPRDHEPPELDDRAGLLGDRDERHRRHQPARRVLPADEALERRPPCRRRARRSAGSGGRTRAARARRAGRPRSAGGRACARASRCRTARPGRGPTPSRGTAPCRRRASRPRPSRRPRAPPRRCWRRAADGPGRPARAAGARPAPAPPPGPASASATTANSSPPTRATVSPGRSVAVSCCCRGDQQRVAGRVAVRVVDVLEPVEVDVEHADERAVAARPAPAPASGGRAAARGSGCR